MKCTIEYHNKVHKSKPSHMTALALEGHFFNVTILTGVTVENRGYEFVYIIYVWTSYVCHFVL